MLFLGVQVWSGLSGHVTDECIQLPESGPSVHVLPTNEAIWLVTGQQHRTPWQAALVRDSLYHWPSHTVGGLTGRLLLLLKIQL